jgi:hypothetical protein
VTNTKTTPRWLPNAGQAVILSTFLVAFYLVLAVSSPIIKGEPFVPKGEIVVQLIRPFYHEGNAYAVPAAVLGVLAEYADDPKVKGGQTSPILLYEDDVLLGPAHNAFFDIHQYGAGRYSHWKDMGIVFSSSDNSDPNTNGRKYWAVKP